MAFAASSTPYTMGGWCVFFGYVGQFFRLASLSWYFVLSVLMFLGVYGVSSSKLQDQNTTRLRHAFVWGTSVIGATLPLVNSSYGNLGTVYERTECWITGADNPLRWCSYFPMFTYVAFSIFLLLFTVYRIGTLRMLDQLGWSVFCRILLFVVFFILVWIGPCIKQFLNLSGDGNPAWLVGFKQVAMCSVGLGNFVVWITSRHLWHAMQDARNEPAQSGNFAVLIGSNSSGSGYSSCSMLMTEKKNTWDSTSNPGPSHSRLASSILSKGIFSKDILGYRTMELEGTLEGDGDADEGGTGTGTGSQEHHIASHH